ncbi:VanZ family protein [Vibrio parahaemolyticus]|uniref:VanZ family protein n=1 Tax=Vibrio parahaemolyticus TaxID=670 RepID=UPI00111DD728|nr:VanZ family protein [Vibrio parahaemolyticus]TOA67461.1 VanZ family protein [Vibrio parahaemolyticus]TOA89059.1 VanZ family protein [Vibrio parahaemolyticus]TOB12685.1 VanZ family protein [Vibrio parahaemolyticus]TOP68363.1 VanZ family protein [Vibrio parahaemolyticus]HCH1624101.1 VanZ family protein [Vibrio parahaemolyticus]
MNLTAARFVILSYAILIAFLSLSSGELQDWGNIAYLDKMQHAMAYSGFAFLGCFCVWRWRQRWAVAIGILTGLLCYRIWSLYRPRLVKSLYSIR